VARGRELRGRLTADRVAATVHRRPDNCLVRDDKRHGAFMGHAPHVRAAGARKKGSVACVRMDSETRKQ
jgi:hypothetical protein